MIPLVASLLAPAALEPPAQAPVDLFKAACTQGSLALSTKNAARIDYKDMPYAARAALGQTLAAADMQVFAGAPKAGEVPGPVYAIGPGKAIYLLLPAADGAASGRFAHSCAIVWKGEHFADARATILPDSQTYVGTMPDSNPMGLAFIGTVAGDLYLSATSLSDWTVLKSVPSSDASLP